MAASTSRFWYGASVDNFLTTSPDAILGQLTTNCDFSLIPTQRDAWLAQIELLRGELKGINGSIFFEFNIPRMGRRIDVVLVVGPIVFAIEFKVGEKMFDRSAIDQVWDYALDLKNFHEASHHVSIVPILLATEVPDAPPVELIADADKVYRPVLVNPASFRPTLDSAYRSIAGSQTANMLPVKHWSSSISAPTRNSMIAFISPFR